MKLKKQSFEKVVKIVLLTLVACHSLVGMDSDGNLGPELDQLLQCMFNQAIEKGDIDKIKQILSEKGLKALPIELLMSGFVKTFERWPQYSSLMLDKKYLQNLPNSNFFGYPLTAENKVLRWQWVRDYAFDLPDGLQQEGVVLLKSVNVSDDNTLPSAPDEITNDLLEKFGYVLAQGSPTLYCLRRKIKTLAKEIKEVVLDGLAKRLAADKWEVLNALKLEYKEENKSLDYILLMSTGTRDYYNERIAALENIVGIIDGKKEDFINEQQVKIKKLLLNGADFKTKQQEEIEPS